MKVLLFVFLMNVVNIYAKPVDDILLMSPVSKKALSMAVKEVADNYSSMGKTKKANAFYRSMLNIYPIGDIAHQIANQINMPLNDEQTFSNFMSMGDQEFTKEHYKHAVAYYLMANELENSEKLYEKITVTYRNMGNIEKADYYQGLTIQSEEEPANARIMQEDSDDMDAQQENMQEMNTNTVDAPQLNAILQADYEKTLN